MNNQNSMVPRIVALVVILLVGAGALAYTFLKKPDATVPISDVTTTPDASTTSPNVTSPTTQNEQSSANTESAEPQASTIPASTPTSTYKDGTYSATGSYISPGGDETIGVSLTLQDDIVTAVTVTPHPVNGEDGTFQGMFAAGISALVVGKNITEVHVTHVSGSSLTSGGFDQAVATIEAEAKA